MEGWRKLFGMGVLIFGLTLYVGLAAWLGTALRPFPWIVELVYYALAGVLWVFPVRTLLRWMGGGAPAQSGE
jgi:hypothetical protein